MMQMLPDLKRCIWRWDLRISVVGSMDWQRSYAFSLSLILTTKIHCFFSVEEECDRIKALLWEGDGFLLMYKRLDNSAFRWPRSADEAMAIIDDQYRMLMQGLEIVARHPISELKETPRIM